jgi:ABC-2 type transport system permease protein
MSKANKYASAASVSLKSAFAYRQSALFGLILYTLFIFVLFSVWKAVYKGGEIAGFSLTQMVWYVCFTEFIVFGCRTNVFNQLNEEVKNGDIAYQLNKPYSYILFKFASALGETVVNGVVYLAAALALGLLFAGPLTTFKLWMLPPVALSMLLGLILSFFTMTALGLTAFYIEENTAFYLLWQKLVFMFGMFLPLEFLPVWLQGIARWLPFPYIAWAPAKLAVAFSWEQFATTVPIQALYCLVFMALSGFIYQRGVKRLNAHGG